MALSCRLTGTASNPSNVKFCFTSLFANFSLNRDFGKCTHSHVEFNWIVTIKSALLRAALEKFPPFLSLAELPKVPGRSERKSVEDECAGVH